VLGLGIDYLAEKQDTWPHECHTKYQSLFTHNHKHKALSLESLKSKKAHVASKEKSLSLILSSSTLPITPFKHFCEIHCSQSESRKLHRQYPQQIDTLISTLSLSLCEQPERKTRPQKHLASQDSYTRSHVCFPPTTNENNRRFQFSVLCHPFAYPPLKIYKLTPFILTKKKKKKKIH
jgi:hypothetical protein